MNSSKEHTREHIEKLIVGESGFSSSEALNQSINEAMMKLFELYAGDMKCNAEAVSLIMARIGVSMATAALATNGGSKIQLDPFIEALKEIANRQFDYTRAANENI